MRLSNLTSVVLLATVAYAATVSVCNTGCTTSNLQTALDSLANCGDTIAIKSTDTQTGNFQLHYRGCGSNPITVTSDRALAGWLPSPYARITPSQLGNLAKIVTTNSSPALSGVLDGMNRPPAGWNLIGLAFQTTGCTFDLTAFNVNNDAANSSQIADNITFDRDYFGMSPVFNGSTCIQDVMRADATNLTVKNSFVGDSFYNGYIESHGIRPLTTVGPVTVTNTFITTSGIPIFVGGATPSYPAYLASGLTAKYNYSWRPWKYNGDPAQPFASDYVSYAQNTLRTGPWTITNVSNTGVITIPAGPPWGPMSLLTITGVGGCTVANAPLWRMSMLTSTTYQLLNFPGCNSAYTSGGTVNEYAVTVCQKSHGEAKWGVGVDWEYNVGENSWESQSCGSQFNGFTDTIRTQWDSNSNGSATLGTVTMANPTHISWSGSYTWAGAQAMGNGQANIGDNAICIQLSTGTECKPITVTTGATSVIATSPFSGTAVNPNVWLVYTASASLTGVTLAHNVFKNVDRGFNVLGLSFSNGVSNAGLGVTHTISHNLLYNSSSYIAGYQCFNMSSGETDYAFNPTSFIYDHNTCYTPFGRTGNSQSSFVYMNANGSPTTPPWTSSAFTNNLFGTSTTPVPFGADSFSGVNDVSGVVNAYMASSNVKNNAIPGGAQVSSPSGGNAVSGNQYQAWVDPFGGGAANNIFIVQPGSMYYNAGTDGASLGADWQLLPMVTGISIAGSTLAFNVNNQNNDVKNTQPCVLEVSSSQNLQNDLGTYSVIASLDPTTTIGADLSTRSDVTLSGNSITWPLTGVVAGTTYYGRIMCYGDTEQFSFVAASTTGGSTLSGKSATNGQSLTH